jgi:hypothetical protein
MTKGNENLEISDTAPLLAFFPLVGAALSTSGRAKSNFPSV